MFGKPFFDILVILYLFLGGASAGAMFVLSAWSLSFHRNYQKHHYRLQRAFKSLLKRGYTISLVLLAFAVLCLLWDLGVPTRALSLFFRPHFTVITFGSYALLLSLLTGLLLTIANLFNLAIINGHIRKALEIICCICSGAVMVYTGIFLASNYAVAFWNTWTLVAVFLFSSLSGGFSIVLLIDYFIKDQTILLRAAKPLQKAHVVCLILETVFIIGFVVAISLDPSAQESLEMLLSNNVFPVAVIGVVGMGIAVPLCLELYNLRTKPYRTIPVSDAVCLIGGFLLRYVIIICGVH